MARPKSRKPVYCLQKPDRAFVRIDGQRVYLGTWGTQESRDEYDRVIGEWIARDRTTPPQVDEEAPSGITVGEIVSHFMRWGAEHYGVDYVAGKRPGGELGNFADAVRPLLRLYWKTSASEFGPLALKAVREEMVRMGWCRNVVNRRVLRLRQVFRWAAGNELITVAVTDARGKLKSKPIGHEIVAAL
jgi:hypothetical protein